LLPAARPFFIFTADGVTCVGFAGYAPACVGPILKLPELTEPVSNL
jgi:hypothetical protein